jgi:ferredoxin
MQDGGREANMRVVVDEKVCQGHARCNALAPEIFDLDDWGHARPGEHDVPPGKEEDAARAVRSCPEVAISVSGEDPAT